MLRVSTVLIRQIDRQLVHLTKLKEHQPTTNLNSSKHKINITITDLQVQMPEADPLGSPQTKLLKNYMMMHKKEETKVTMIDLFLRENKRRSSRLLKDLIRYMLVGFSNK